VRFAGDDKIEVGWRKELLVFVIAQERLNRADNDFRPPPIIPIFFEDDGRAVIGEKLE